METTKKSLLIFLALIVVGGSAYGAFYLLKKYIKKTPEVLVNTTATTTPITIPGFTQEAINKVPMVFPKGLIVEKDITPVESFSVKGVTETQYTYRYITKLTADENYKNFTTFASSNEWKIVANVKFGSGWSINFSKEMTDLLLVYSFNTITKEAVMDITLSTKK